MVVHEIHYAESDMKFVTIGELVNICNQNRDCAKCEAYCFCKANGLLDNMPGNWMIANQDWAYYNPEDTDEE